jgi:hypothetical protein
MLELNADKVAWSYLDRINWSKLSANPNAIHLLAPLDTNAMRENCKPFAEELTAYVFHPLRLENMSNAYGYELDEYMEYL